MRRQAYYFEGDKGESVVTREVPAELVAAMEEKRAELVERLGEVGSAPLERVGALPMYPLEIGRGGECSVGEGWGAADVSVGRGGGVLRWRGFGRRRCIRWSGWERRAPLVEAPLRRVPLFGLKINPRAWAFFNFDFLNGGGPGGRRDRRALCHGGGPL